MEIGRLKPVPLRELWEGEATHFTPWLAEEENLTLLGETLGLRLELRGVEQQIGSFIADIVAEDIDRSSIVLVENQLAPTDHRHLGQILAYAAGINAETIVWIAEKVRDEHRAAVDWLNEISGTRFRFFAIEVQAWTIGDKIAAPQFQVVSKPNDWSKRAFTSSESNSTELSESQKRWREYWQGLIDIVGDRIPGMSNRTAYKGNWQCGDGLRLASDVYVEFNASCPRDGLRAEAYIGGPRAKLVYHALATDKAVIESEFGETLNWEELASGQDSRIAIYKGGERAVFDGDASAQFEWLVTKLAKLRDVLSPRLRAIDLEALDSEADENLGDGG
ncbi:MAG: hypothetical protein DHS20C06_21240 [Hyphobacterium sp.]|nr:MAG: hypothetical protein DHS20C06_21240 [Hyphobacterium sp.]